MKLVAITPYFYPRVGGLENYALKILEGLEKHFNWDVTVITSNPNGKNDVREKVGNIEVIRLGTTFRLSNTPVGTDWFQKITDLVKEIKPDLVTAHTPVPFISDLGIQVARNAHIPTVLTYHNDIFKDNLIFKAVSFFYYTFLGNKTLELSDKIIVTSDHYITISQRLKAVSKKLVVIPPGFELKKLAKSSANKKTPYVLFVGQLDETHRHKGLDVLIESFSLLQKKYPELNLFIVGKGSDSERYGEVIMHLNLHEQVHLKGFVSDAEIGEYYANAVCVCLPSTTQAEGFGMVIIEAAGQKTPAIGSNVGGIPSAIINGETGLLVEANNDEALAKAIEKLHTNPVLRDEMGEKAYSRVVKDFTWDKQVQKTDALFRSLIK